MFFSEEKNQKTFSRLSRSLQAAPEFKFAKVFCFFSTEKKTFLTYVAVFARSWRITGLRSGADFDDHVDDDTEVIQSAVVMDMFAHQR